MKSILMKNPNRSRIIELADFLLVPTSFIRFAHYRVKSGRWDLSDQTNSKLIQSLPYLGALGYETGRICAYYKLAEKLFS